MKALLIATFLGLYVVVIACDEATSTTTVETPTTPVETSATPASTPTASPTPVPAASPTPLSFSAREILQRSAANMANVVSLHYEMETSFGLETSTGTANVPITLVGDYQAPDRSKAAMSVSFIFLTIESRVVVIGETAYFTNPATGEWQVSEGAAPFFADPAGLITAKVEELQNAVVVGEESLDGERVYHLAGTTPPGFFDEAVGEFKAGFWIGVDDFLLKKMVAEGQIELDEDATAFIGGVATGSVAVSLTLTLSDFGKPVSIEAPDVGSSP